MADPFDHELKIGRAFNHLMEIDAITKEWVNGEHHSVRYETDDKTGAWTVFATAEQPPVDPLSLLIGEFLHNARAGLDNLAFTLSNAYTNPMTAAAVSGSEFPIFGDVSRSGKLGMGAQMFASEQARKVGGMDPKAQTLIEGFQPYNRGAAFRTHPLWHLHELDRINKHRLLHTAFLNFSGMLWPMGEWDNVNTMEGGVMESFEGTIKTDTPIASFPRLTPIDPNAEMKVKVEPALKVAFAPGTMCVDDELVYETLRDIYTFIKGEVLPALNPFLT